MHTSVLRVDWHDGCIPVSNIHAPTLIYTRLWWWWCGGTELTALAGGQVSSYFLFHIVLLLCIFNTFYTNRYRMVIEWFFSTIRQVRVTRGSWPFSGSFSPCWCNPGKVDWIFSSRPAVTLRCIILRMLLTITRCYLLLPLIYNFIYIYKCVVERVGGVLSVRPVKRDRSLTRPTITFSHVLVLKGSTTYRFTHRQPSLSFKNQV